MTWVLFGAAAVAAVVTGWLYVREVLRGGAR